jgi:hypothetical protein
MSWIRNTGVQAMVEFRDLETAIRARKELHGCDIYSGCCTIKMEYAKTERLNVRQNDEKTWDFTADFSNKAGQHRGHDMGASQRLGDFYLNLCFLLIISWLDFKRLLVQKPLALVSVALKKCVSESVGLLGPGPLILCFESGPGSLLCIKDMKKI